MLWSVFLHLTCAEMWSLLLVSFSFFQYDSWHLYNSDSDSVSICLVLYCELSEYYKCDSLQVLSTNFHSVIVFGNFKPYYIYCRFFFNTIQL